MHDCQERGGHGETHGRPFLDHLLIPNPAAGANLAFELDSRWDWRPVAVNFLYDADASVATRIPTLIYADPEQTEWVAAPPLDGSAALAASDWYVWTRGGSAYTTGGVVHTTPLPDVWLPGGWQLATDVVGIQAGDQIHDIFFVTEKRLTQRR